MINFEDYKEIFKNKNDFNLLIEKLSKLKSKKDNLIVSDFDDTIFSTKEVIDKDVRKWRRWEEWNDYIMKVIWLNKFIQDFYVWKDFPKEIISKLDKSKDLILTTWIYELQEAKIKTCKLDNYNYIIVPYAIDKILELIKYIVLELKYLPSEITIYEDRIQNFVNYKNFLENFLNTKINLFKVEINWNNKNIKEIIRIEK